MRLTTIKFNKNYFYFSAGHFSIFSETEREKLHGHNFSVQTEILSEVNENGIAFDYQIYRRKIEKLCGELNGYFLLPQFSPYLKLIEHEDNYCAIFNNEKLFFLKKDILIMPLRNITIEELARWFLEKLINEKTEIIQYRIHAIKVQVFSTATQSAGAVWKNNIVTMV